MKNTPVSNRGATLIELITSIAILSVVGISCFMLLMFSIRTNTFIVTGTSACRDAEVLNNRLEHLLKDAEVSVEEKEAKIIIKDNNGNEVVLQWIDGSILQLDGSEIQEDITDFEIEPIEKTLLRISYTIDNTYDSTKIFNCKTCNLDSEDTEST